MKVNGGCSPLGEVDRQTYELLLVPCAVKISIKIVMWDIEMRLGVLGDSKIRLESLHLDPVRRHESLL